MSLSDWALVGYGELDAAVKYAGNSSMKLRNRSGGTSTLTHNTFSENQAQVILWTRYHEVFGTGTGQYINMAAYGNISCLPTQEDVWQKWRITFWYDSGSNTKFGRRELWTGGEWIQQGQRHKFWTRGGG